MTGIIRLPEKLTKETSSALIDLAGHGISKKNIISIHLDSEGLVLEVLAFTQEGLALIVDDQAVTAFITMPHETQADG